MQGDLSSTDIGAGKGASTPSAVENSSVADHSKIRRVDSKGFHWHGLARVKIGGIEYTLDSFRVFSSGTAERFSEEGFQSAVSLPYG